MDIILFVNVFSAIGHQCSLAGIIYLDAIIFYEFKETHIALALHSESAVSMKAQKKTKLIKIEFEFDIEKQKRANDM